MTDPSGLIRNEPPSWKCVEAWEGRNPGRLPRRRRIAAGALALAAANEGQADYFATLKCLRRVLVLEADSTAGPAVEAACSRAFSDEAGRGLCRGGTRAGLSAAWVHQSVQCEPRAPAFATPDPSVVEQMFPSIRHGRLRPLQ